MRPHRRLSPHSGKSRKTHVLVVVGLILAGQAVAGPAENTATTILGPAERVWYALVTEAPPEPTPRTTDARWQWVAGDLADLRRLEGSDTEAAIAGYQRLLSAAVVDGDSLAVLVACERLAFVAIATHQIAAARPRLDRSLALATDLQQPMAALRAHLDLGRVLVRTREVEAAATNLDLVRQSELAPPLWRADAALSLSIVARLRMDLSIALSLREEAYALYTEAGSVAGQAQSLHYIGTTHAMLGELSRAMARLQAAEELARTSNNEDVLAGCLGDQAGIRYLTGDFDRAAAQYREASDLASDPRRKGWYLTNLASILAHRGKYAEAVPRYEQALAMVRDTGDRRTEGTILLALGQSRCVLGEVEAGLANLDSAFVHAEAYELPLDAAKALEVKGHALIDADRLDEAEPLLREAVARADKLGYFDLQEWARAGVAEIARRRGRLDEARRQLEQAVDLVQQVRRRAGGSAEVQSGYFSQVGRSFDALVKVLFELQERDGGSEHGRHAWEVAQQGRARSLLDLLAEAEVDLRVRADTSYQARETVILEGIAALEARRRAAPDSADVIAPQIRQLEGELTVLETELRRADPRYAALRYPQPIDLAALRADVLDEGEAVIEYQLGEHQSHLWFVTHDRFEFHPLPPQAEIEQLVKDLLPLLADPSLTGDAAAWYAAPAWALSRVLLASILPDLVGVERLIVVPDGMLHYVPFAALVTEESRASSFRELPWLASRVEVVTTPAVGALARLRAAPAVPSTAAPLLLLADPELPPVDEASVFVRAAGAAGLAPAPGAKLEQQQLISLYGRRAHWWAGREATVARLTTRPPGGGPWRSVHLATHGVVNEDRPQYSGLVLAPTDTDDGFLNVAEIFALDLDCDQVVLSACSTALGEIVDGEGLVGIVHAFLYAGARSVLAALWDVDGEGTARFMESYYRYLESADGEARTTALAAARRALAGDPGRTSRGVPLAHPGIWAAFTAVGDAR